MSWDNLPNEIKQKILKINTQEWLLKYKNTKQSIHNQIITLYPILKKFWKTKRPFCWKYINDTHVEITFRKFNSYITYKYCSDYSQHWLSKKPFRVCICETWARSESVQWGNKI